MSALGQKRTSKRVQSMSALPPKADIGTGPRITFGARAPAAWRYSPRSAAPRPAEQFGRRFAYWRWLNREKDPGRRPPTGVQHDRVRGSPGCRYCQISCPPKISGAPLSMDRGQLLLANTANLLAK